MDQWNTKPDTAAEALELWDAGHSVFTVEMGGLGPGYEQVIHIAAFEFVRELLKREPINWGQATEEATPAWAAFVKTVEDAVDPKLKALGMSGAQYGAAKSVAFRTVRIGWAQALDEVPDRLIQVSRTWPQIDEPASDAAVARND